MSGASCEFAPRVAAAMERLRSRIPDAEIARLIDPADPRRTAERLEHYERVVMDAIRRRDAEEITRLATQDGFIIDGSIIGSNVEESGQYDGQLVSDAEIRAAAEDGPSDLDLLENGAFTSLQKLRAVRNGQDPAYAGGAEPMDEAELRREAGLDEILDLDDIEARAFHLLLAHRRAMQAAHDQQRKRDLAG